jgi:hypothetical protein
LIHNWTSRTAAALLVFLFAASVYRAATQSITIDEAFTFNLYLAGDFKDIFTNYDAANHVLYTLLARASVAMFSASELTMRLPSLLGGAILFAALYRLARLVFGGGPMMLLTVSIVALNPYLLDFLSAARGYGLALGLFLCGLQPLIRAREMAPARASGVAFGLSIAANLTLLFPVVAACAAYLIAVARFHGRAGLARFADHVALPALVVAGVILVVPLAHARPDQFYYGAATLAHASESLAYGSIVHHPAPGAERHAALVRFVAFRVAPAMTLAIAVGWAIHGGWWLRRPRGGGAHEAWWIVAGALVGSVALAWLANRLFGVLFPLGRTGLHLLILFLLACPIAALHAWERPAGRIAAVPLAVALILAAGWFATRWNTRVYSDWPFNAATRPIVEVMRERERRSPREGVRVGGSWLFEPGLNFYRRTLRLSWMRPVERGDPGGSYDYYVLLPEDRGVMERLHLNLIYYDPSSGAALAAPSR